MKAIWRGEAAVQALLGRGEEPDGQVPPRVERGRDPRPVEERTSLSPDALTGMEANLRFPLPETQATRIFGRLSAWQNWIFIRPNATGDKGALKVYGSGAQPKFDWDRV